MNVFHCDHCGALVFFENVQCVNCRRTLAFLQDQRTMSSLDATGSGQWRSPLRSDVEYRLCANYAEHNVCNWAIPTDSADTLCLSCRLTSVIPDISQLEQKTNWYKLETAKRRLIYSLMALSLPLVPKSEDAQRGLTFEFKSSSRALDAEPVMIGHANGVITINADEADDAERERHRLQLHEPYRTVLGHFRHEIGHYYWDRLIARSNLLEAFRELFGDERQNYSAALQRHYDNSPPTDWAERFVSAYSSAHPWEDWAETWAHYLHMADTLDTAAACGLMLKPKRADEPSIDSRPSAGSDFDRMIQDWHPLTYMINSLNRGLGLADPYPFVLSTAAIAKLRFVHDVIHSHAAE
jgi:hypothetical protein